MTLWLMSKSNDLMVGDDKRCLAKGKGRIKFTAPFPCPCLLASIDPPQLFCWCCPVQPAGVTKWVQAVQVGFPIGLSVLTYTTSCGCSQRCSTSTSFHRARHLARLQYYGTTYYFIELSLAYNREECLFYTHKRPAGLWWMPPRANSSPAYDTIQDTIASIPQAVKQAATTQHFTPKEILITQNVPI